MTFFPHPFRPLARARRTSAPWRLASLLLLALVAVAGVAQAQVRVVATTTDLAAVAKAVGGAHVDVTALSSSTQNPHYVDARPNLIVPLSRAQLLIVNGLELETGWLPPLIANARNRAIQPGSSGYFDASTAIEVLGRPAGTVDRSRGDVHIGGNPHYMLDPRRAKSVANALSERFIAMDPTNAAAFRAQNSAFQAELDTLISQSARQFSALPAAKRQIVTYHSSLTYLTDWLQLSEVATIEPLPGIDPTPRHTANVLQLMRAQNVRAILQEEFYPRSTSTTLANMTSAQIVALPGGTRFERGETYVAHIRALMRAIFEALNV